MPLLPLEHQGEDKGRNLPRREFSPILLGTLIKMFARLMRAESPAMESVSYQQCLVWAGSTDASEAFYLPLLLQIPHGTPRGLPCHALMLSRFPSSLAGPCSWLNTTQLLFEATKPTSTLAFAERGEGFVPKTSSLHDPHKG